MRGSALPSRLRGTWLAFLLVGAALAAMPASGLDSGDRAPEFALPSLDGTGTVELGRHRGKIVYLDFWA
jgi:hypothetical protein